MADIRRLTADYVAAFDSCDLQRVASFLSERFELTDPEVTELTPKASVLEYINGLFESNGNLDFAARRILVDGDVSVIHFTLTLGETELDGVDVIEWEAGKMVSMHAYLTPRKTDNTD